ncbi:MAG: polyphosphate polymerase domain-containing protein [Rikenellaceae bacterium]
MRSINEAISKFQGISLVEMDAVKLMNRTDRKYWFHSSGIADLLEAIVDNYYILEVDGERNMPYSTIYYDTPTNEMYANHQRGKGNRYKIRRRSYVSSKSSFLEVKFKSNKGRTIKVRKGTDFGSVTFNSDDQEFIEAKSPYTCGQLRESLKNNFCRLMLVSKNMNERCTIDSCLQFNGADDKESELDDLVIVEVKTDGRSRSAIIEALNLRRIKPSGFSKYCIGRSLIDTELKQNNFKSKLRMIEKIINNPINKVVI